MRGIVAFVAGLMVTGVLACGARASELSREEILGTFNSHYVDRYKEFIEENRRLRYVVFLGDSLTQQFDVRRQFPGKPVLNRGVAGDTIGIRGKKSGLLHRLDVSVFDCYTTHVFLLIGVNEFWAPRPIEEMMAAYRQVIETIQAGVPGVTIHVQSLPPTREGFARFNPGILEFNKHLRPLAESLHCDFIDLHPLFADENGELRAEFSKDGLHFTLAAYRVWKTRVDEAMGWTQP